MEQQPHTAQSESRLSPDPPRLVEILHVAFCQRAAETGIACLTIGLGYTAVETAHGDVGLSYTMVDRSTSCTRVRAYRNYEGQPATQLLDLLLSDDSLERSLGIATVNALNRSETLPLPADAAEGDFIGAFGVRQGTRVSMVGFFGPVVARLRRLGVELRILDHDRGMGDESAFLADLGHWPDVLILTGTSILSAAFERFVEAACQGVKVLVLGPTTPLVPAAYAPFPVHMLGGMVVVETDEAVAAVRQGAGTRELLPLCRKVSLTVKPVQTRHDAAHQASLASATDRAGSSA